ncbi:hypothetical protein V8B97DRAFT_1970817 [Scleroderma yunnanense]
MITREQVIVVMGPTGVGKSSFIRNSVPPGVLVEVKLGHNLQSETIKVQPVCWVTGDGMNVKLVDTPGFDNPREGITDTQVFKMIVTFLTNEYKGKTSPLTGLIYAHRISDTVVEASERNLRMFRKLCGDDSLKNVVFVTTMWDKVTLEEGGRLEQDLVSSNGPFRPFLDEGAIMMRYDRTSDSAADIINILLQKSPTTLQIVREISEQKMTLQDTAVGAELHNEIRERLRKHKKEVVKAEMRGKMQKDFTKERERMVRAMAELLKELDELKQGLASTPQDPPSDGNEPNNFPAPPNCLSCCRTLLRVVEKYESSLAPVYPDIASSIVFCIVHFADSVERSVKSIQHALLTLKSALALEDMYSLQQFIRANPSLRTFTHGTWAKAKDDMMIVVNDIATIWSSCPNPGFADRVWNIKGSRRLNALKEISQLMNMVVGNLRTMVEWWEPVVEAIGKMEDAAHRQKGETGFADKTIIVALPRIIHALEAYCEAYAQHAEYLQDAAMEMSL